METNQITNFKKESTHETSMDPEPPNVSIEGLVNERQTAQKSNALEMARLQRQTISTSSVDELDEAPNSVLLVQLANASYLRELTRYETTF